jgi:transposase InsO family protein
MQDWEKYLEQVWNHSAVKFTGPQKMYDYIKSENKYKIGKFRITSWLNKQEAYALHKQTRKPTRMGRYYTNHLDHIWTVDIMDYANKESLNSGYKYALIFLDLLSRYVWIRILKRKTPEEVIIACKSVFGEGRKPKLIYSDRGSEFKNFKLARYLKGKNIKQYFTHNVEKSSPVERVIRTIKSRLSRAMHAQGTDSWYLTIPDIVANYNNTKHSSTSYKPALVNEGNYREVLKKLYYDIPTKEIKIKTKPSKRYNEVKYAFPINSTVRLLKLRGSFFKENMESHSRELFTISHRFYREGIPVYEIVDFLKEPVQGRLLQNELFRAHYDPDKLWVIDEVFRNKTRIINGEHHVQVSWVGWNSMFNSYVKSSEIKSI